MDILQMWQTGDWGIRIFLIVAAYGLTGWAYVLFRLIAGYSFSRMKPDKDHPKELQIQATGDAFITLERVWFKGQWRYMVKGGLPYRFAPPDEERERLRNRTPRALKEDG